MPDGLSFDELNKLHDRYGKLRSMPYEEYFGDMDLSDEQKQRRIQTAKDIEEFTLLALISMYYMRQSGGYDIGSVSADMSDAYNEVIERLDIPHTDTFSQTHIQNVVADVINTTMKNPDEAYSYSYDRARFIAENEANSVWNDSEYEDALESGMTMKRWSAIMDKKTRDTHREVNGKEIPIEDLFQVGDSLMRYARDEAYGAGAEEIVNCRCSVIYF